MRWVSIVLSVNSLVLLTLAAGSGALALLPARGGEALLDFGGATLLGALVAAAIAGLLAVVDFRRLRGRPGRSAALVAVILAAIALLSAAGGKLLVVALSAAGAQSGSP